MKSWPTPVPKNTRLNPDIRFNQIVTAGVEIAMERGFYAVRAETVAERCGCSVSLVRLYGGTRDALWKAVAQRALITRKYKAISEAKRLDLYPK